MQIRGRNERVRVTTDCSGPSATKQAFAYECDVNVIVERYRKTGDPSILGVPNGPPNYADVSDIGDYAECLAVVKNAEEAFLKLPAKVRDQFGNDPARLVEAALDPSKRDLLVSLGIVENPSKDSPDSQNAGDSSKAAGDASKASPSASVSAS